MALKVGIQLYSVRELMKQDPIKTTYQVADAGYKYLEAANHNALEDQGIGFGVSAEELKKFWMMLVPRLSAPTFIRLIWKITRRSLNITRRSATPQLFIRWSIFPAETM